MPRGYRQHGSDSDSYIDQFAARIQERILLFSAETGISADRVTTRLSELFSPPGSRVQHYVSELREETPRIRGGVEPLALAQHAHRRATPPTIEAGRSASEDDEHALSRPRSQHRSYWARMTPEERSAESARRRKKWSPEAKAKWRGGGRGELSERAVLKQKIYQERHNAKKLGLPLPPLPESTRRRADAKPVNSGKPGRKPGRKPKAEMTVAEKSKQSMNKYWSQFTPEQRKEIIATRNRNAEQRRQAAVN